MEKKKTIGSQVLEKTIENIDDKGAECREVTLEWGKQFNKLLDDIINEHRSFADHYYIVLYAQKEIWSEQVVRTKYIIRKTRPTPEWRQMVYSYNNKINELKYHWALPQSEVIGRAILSNPTGFDKQLVRWIDQYLNGTLS